MDSSDNTPPACALPLLRIAVMGCGRWGRNLVRVIRDLAGARLTWLVDPDPAQLEQARSIAPDVPACGHISETGYDFDAAVVATPALDHAAHAIDILQRKKHVLVEKPAAVTTRDACALVETAHRSGVQLMAGHQLLFHDGFYSLGRIVREGRIGSLREVIAVRTAALDLRKEPGALWSLGPHDVAMILSLLSTPPTSVRGEWSPAGSATAATVARIQLSFPPDIRAMIELSSASDSKTRLFSVRGTAGTITLDDSVRGGTLRLETAAGDRYVETPMGEPLAAECAHFVAAIRTGGPPLTGADHLISVTSLLSRAVGRPSPT